MKVNTLLPYLGIATLDDLYTPVLKRDLECIAFGTLTHVHGQNEDGLLDQFLQAVARVFIKLRIHKGYPSYEAFAYSNNFPRAQYWRVENGRFNITLRTIVKLLIIHELTLAEFIVMLFAEMQYGGKEKHSIGAVKDEMIEPLD